MFRFRVVSSSYRIHIENDGRTRRTNAWCPALFGRCPSKHRISGVNNSSDVAVIAVDTAQ